MSDSKFFILVVEDEEAQQDIMQEYLGEFYDVTCVQNGKEALAFFKENFRKVDLILLDLNLPDMTGYELKREFLAIAGSSMPHIVVVTAYDSTMDWVQSLTEIQCFYHIGKPFSRDILLDTVSQALYGRVNLHRRDQTKLYLELCTILERRNTRLLAECVSKRLAQHRSCTVEEIDQLIVRPHVIYEKGLQYLVDVLAKDAGKTVEPYGVPTVLLVEDEPDVCALAQTVFEQKGIPLITALSLKEAQDILKKNDGIHVIFLDLQLPDGDGVSFLKWVFVHSLAKDRSGYFENLNRPDVVITSAFNDKEKITECIHAGATAYMPKPVVFEDMVHMAEKLYARRSALGAIRDLVGVS